MVGQHVKTRIVTYRDSQCRYPPKRSDEKEGFEVDAIKTFNGQVDYSPVLHRYDLGTRLVIRTGDPVLFHVSAVYKGKADLTAY